MIKKQWVVALVLFLLIPCVLKLEGTLFGLVNPESAAGHPDYAQNYHRLSQLRHMALWGSEAAVAVLWLLVCLLVIRSKKRSLLWLFLAALGPFGFAVLAMLNDRAPAENDSYARFVRNLNWFVRAGYELCTFVMVWVLADEGMVFKRNLMIRHEAAITGMSVAQIIDQQNASSGMWAFAEGSEVMYLVILLYLLRPIVFNIVGRVAAMMASPKAKARA
ncbi:MAG: hypothetical protein ACLPOO_06085 [Terriglobales bacterium]